MTEFGPFDQPSGKMPESLDELRHLFGHDRWVKAAGGMAARSFDAAEPLSLDSAYADARELERIHSLSLVELANSSAEDLLRMSETLANGMRHGTEDGTALDAGRLRSAVTAHDLLTFIPNWQSNGKAAILSSRLGVALPARAEERNGVPSVAEQLVTGFFDDQDAEMQQAITERIIRDSRQ